jgi:ParB-like chromosome segregation protein Spo0J
VRAFPELRAARAGRAAKREFSNGDQSGPGGRGGPVDGNILDGHHRKRVVDELGIKDYPTVVRRFSSEEEKEEHVVTLNVRRRHLNGEQKRRWVAWFLKRHPEWSNRRIGSEVGLAHPTVAEVRKDLEVEDGLVKFTSRVGKDGKARPAEQPKPQPQPSIFSTSRQTERAQKALSGLGDAAPAKQLDIKRAERIVREKAAEERRAQPTKERTVTADIDIRHGDFRHILIRKITARPRPLARVLAPVASSPARPGAGRISHRP